MIELFDGLSEKDYGQYQTDLILGLSSELREHLPARHKAVVAIEDFFSVIVRV